MKRLIFNKVFFVLFAATVALSSCGNNDEETPAPTIRISSTDPASVGGVVSTIAGEEVEITLVTNAEEKIKRINATQKIGTSETPLSGFPINSFTGDRKSDTRVVTYTVPSSATGDIALRFEVTDDKDKVAAVTVTIRTVADINTYSAILLNNQSDGTSPNAFYDPINNEKFTLAQAKARSADVHIIHALRNAGSGGRKLISPSSSDATEIYGDAGNTNNITTWTTRNNTKFKALNLSETEFNNVSTTAAIKAAAGASDSFTADNVGNLEVGSTFAALITNGKFLVGRVTAVNGNSVFTQGANNAGSVTVTFKVEK